MRSHTWKAARRRLSHQDRCYYCKCEWSLNPRLVPTIDHVLPKARGGTNSPDNLVLACHVCNGKKGVLLVEEFLPVMHNRAELKRVTRKIERSLTEQGILKK